MISLNKKVRDTFWNTMGSGTFAAISFLLLITVTREYGITKAASFGVAITTSQLLFRIGIFAVRQYQITDIGEKYKFSDYFMTKLITTVICLVIFILYILVARITKDDFWEFFFLFLFYQLLSLDDLFQNRFFQKGRLDQSGKTKCFVIGGYLFIFLGLSAYGIELTWVLAVAFFISAVISYFCCFRAECVSVEFLRESKAKNVLLMCLPAFLSNFLLAFINSLPKYTMFYICSKKESGYLNNIFVLLNMVELVGSFIYYPFIPDIMKSISDGKEKIRRLTFKISTGIIFFDILAMMFFVICGDKLLGMIYHADFSEYIFEIVYVIGICGMFVSFIGLFYWFPIMLREQKVIVVIFINGFLISFICCILGTLIFGMRGAIVGHSIGTGVMTCLLVAYFLRKTRTEYA